MCNVLYRLRKKFSSLDSNHFLFFNFVLDDIPFQNLKDQEGRNFHSILSIDISRPNLGDKCLCMDKAKSEMTVYEC